MAELYCGDRELEVPVLDLIAIRALQLGPSG